MSLKQRKPIGTIGLMAGTPFNHMPFTLSWGKMCAYNARYLETPDTYVHLENSTVSEHSLARNELVMKTQGHWLLMLDMDHHFEPDLAERLLHLMAWGDARFGNVDVVSGIYVRRNPPHIPLINGPREADGSYGPIGSWEPKNRPMWVNAVGAGCMLVKTSMFRRIMSEMNEMPFDPRLCTRTDGGPRKMLSEDYSFCDRLYDLGIKILVDPRIEHHHLNTVSLGLDNWHPEEHACRPDDVTSPLGGEAGKAA